MKLRYINKPDVIVYSGNFNLCSTNEIIIHSEDGSDSDSISNFEILIDNKWKLLTKAFKDKDIITDNHNTIFFEPLSS